MENSLKRSAGRGSAAWKWATLVAVFAVLAFVSLRLPPSSDSRESHDAAFTAEGLLKASADELKSTIITPVLDEPIPRSQNVLWCATFQLAWNEACALIGEDIHLEKDPPMVARLNRKAVTKKDIDAASYVALAGFVRDGIEQKIEKALAETFHGAATPHLTRPRKVWRPQDIVAYCYLFKNLEFPVPFQRLDNPIIFQGTKVACFGMEGRSPKQMEMCAQVAILDYKSSDDFIIELKTKSAGDRFILARVAPEKTLGATVAAVAARIAQAKPSPASPGDVLEVPKFNFDLTREYREFYDQTLKVSNPKVAKDLGIVSALQNIRFQLDEKGVRLRSESHVGFGCAAEAPPRHIMVFDKPFLMILERTDAKEPYFALWVGSPELLVAAK